MKQKIRDFIHESVDVDVIDDYTEECYIAFCGPMWLTPEGEREFKDALDLEVEYKPGGDIVSILVDDPDDDRAERNLKAVTHLFYAMAGYDSTVEEYEGWFLDEEPEPAEQEQRTLWLRLGVILKATPQEIHTLLIDDIDGTKGAQILWKAFREGRLTPNGDTYIPGECIEDYNREHGTQYVEEEIGYVM